MHSFHYILFFVFLLISSTASAQEIPIAKSDSVAEIDGYQYVIHLVQPKQTLFSVAKTYEVKLSRIAFDNPGVLDGLKLGQALRILKSAQGETRESELGAKPLEVEGKYVLYTVPKQQTLYAISKEYNTTIEAILDANPELSEGLKVGSTIKVPVPNMLGENATETVAMVGLPNIIMDRVKREIETQSSSRVGNVALMLPLYLDLNDTVMVRKLEEEPELIYERSEVGLAFYQGFLMAMDSLNSEGVKVNVSVFDTENRPWKVKELIKKGKLNDFDLIVGPLYGKVFSEVAQFAYTNCIPVVSPTLKGQNLVNSNDYVLKLIPSEESMVYSLGQYLALSDSTENLILHYGAKSELELVKAFQKGVLSINPKATSQFKQLNIYETNLDSLRNSLSLLGRNNLIVLSSNEARLASLLRNMSGWLEEAYIVGFVPSSWKSFKNIGMDYFDKFRIHAPAPFYLDFERLDVQNFVLEFRKRFKTEPSTFAFRGYDLAMHFLRNLDGMIDDDLTYLETVEGVGLQNDFSWKQIPSGGLENQGVRIVDYTNYELKVATD